MANKLLFQSNRGAMVPVADTTNEAGGRAYTRSAKNGLVQLAVTGCLNSTFYTGPEQQLKTVLQFAKKCEADFIGKTAIYCRRKGFMKDMPALLCAYLAVRDLNVLKKVFPQVIDNGKMLRNFVQMIRSGAMGRKSLGHAPKKLVRDWIQSRYDNKLFRDSVGNDPSIADIIRMVHPKPVDEKRKALYAYIIGRDYNAGDLPPLVQHYEQFKAKEVDVPPDVPFQMLASLDIGPSVWKEIARNAGWHMTRMNINTFARHGVLEDPELVKVICERLVNREEIAKSRVFPYQLLTAYTATVERDMKWHGTVGGNIDVPKEISNALQDAMEIAAENVPEIPGNVYIFPDVSGSMCSPVTGYRKGSTTAATCIDVAALITAVILRKNPNAYVWPFSDKLNNINLNPRDSIMTNSTKLAAIGGGGTECSLPLQKLVSIAKKVDYVIYVSDQESWIETDREYYGSYNRGTETMKFWNSIKKRNPDAKMACIDIQAYGSTQVKPNKDILQIGGFSDVVFDVLCAFGKGELGPENWISEIEKIEL